MNRIILLVCMGIGLILAGLFIMASLPFYLIDDILFDD